jgi:hypothetical protein
MGCKVNGVELDPSSVTLNRVRLTDECINGAGDTIAIDYTVLWELQMEQMIVHLEAVPTTVTDEIILQKVSVDGVRFDTVLIRVNPNEKNLIDLACLCPYRWTVGDRVVITFPNTEDVDVGVEFMGKEV